MPLINPKNIFTYDNYRLESIDPKNWSNEEIIRFIATGVCANDAHTIQKHLARHLDPNATYIGKEYMKPLLIHVLNLTREVGLNEQSAIQVKLREGIAGCSEGLIIRLNDLARSFNRPKNMNQLLTYLREELVSQIAHQLTDEVHTYNALTLYAAQNNLGVCALHAEDVYSNSHTLTEQQKAIFNVRFKEAYTGWLLLNNLIAIFYQELQDHYGYRGYDSDGYKLYEYEAIISLLEQLLQCGTLAVTDVFDLDEESSGVTQLNGPRLIALYLQCLVEQGYLMTDANELLFLQALAHNDLKYDVSTVPYMIELVRYPNLLKHYSPASIDAIFNCTVEIEPHLTLQAYKTLLDLSFQTLSFTWFANLSVQWQESFFAQALSSTAHTHQSSIDNIVAWCLELEVEKRFNFLRQATSNRGILILAARHQPDVLTRLLDDMNFEQKILLMNARISREHTMVRSFELPFDILLHHHPLKALAFFAHLDKDHQLKLLDIYGDKNYSKLLCVNYYKQDIRVSQALLKPFSNEELITLLHKQFKYLGYNMLTQACMHSKEILAMLLARLSAENIAVLCDMYDSENSSLLIQVAQNKQHIDCLIMILNTLTPQMQHQVILAKNAIGHSAYDVAVAAHNQPAMKVFEFCLQAYKKAQEPSPKSYIEELSSQFNALSFFSTSSSDSNDSEMSEPDSTLPAPT